MKLLASFSSVSGGEILHNKASVCVTFVNVSLAKASHIAKERVKEGGATDARSKILLQRGMHTMMTRICDDFAIQYSILQSTTPFFICIPLTKIRKDNTSKLWKMTCKAEYWHTLASNYIYLGIQPKEPLAHVKR